MKQKVFYKINIKNIKQNLLHIELQMQRKNKKTIKNGLLYVEPAKCMYVEQLLDILQFKTSCHRY